ncbi:MAG: cation diffusion facilitator family transporter [Saprospiraceae bacterium]
MQCNSNFKNKISESNWRTGCRLGITAAKFFAWWFTNSNAILTDALESIINVVALRLCPLFAPAFSQTKDSNHPYGHGKVEFIKVGVEGAHLLAGAVIIGKGGYNLLNPQVIHSVDVGMVLVALAGLVNFGLGWWLERTGKRNQSMVLVADGKHLRADAWSSLGLLVGLGLFYFTQITWIDNVTAIIFGGIILITGYQLLRTSVAGIMDEADYQLISKLVNQLEQQKTENWIDLHNFRVIKYGGRLHIDCHLSVPWYFTVADGHQEVKRFEDEVRKLCQMPVELFVHADPCRPPDSCSICEKKNCTERKAAFVKRVDWDLKSAMGTLQHRVD